ncbi:MAG: RodZ domain-containing protein [Anaerolineae bacterium]
MDALYSIPFFDSPFVLSYINVRLRSGCLLRELAMGQVGERLRQARQAKGMSLEQAEEITRIRMRFLQALEDEDYGQIPGQVFVRGFLRSYARTLGLDPDEVLAAAGLAPTGPVLQPVRQPRPEQVLDEPLLPPSNRHGLLAVVLGTMVVVGLALAAVSLYRYLEPQREPPPLPSVEVETVAYSTPRPTETPTDHPSATPTATVTSIETALPASRETAVPGQGAMLRVEAVQAAWLRVLVDGQLVYEGTLSAGQAMEWAGQQRVTLRCGNAGGIRAWFNGQEQAALGAPGEVVEITWRADGATPPQVQPTVEVTTEPIEAPPGTETPPAPPADATPTEAPTATPEGA